MSKDAYYFSHDANARHDPKCQMLTAKFGMEGYGVFWAVIESMREQNGYGYPVKLADALDMDCKCNAKAIIDYCIEIGLMVIVDGHYRAPGLDKRMKHLDEVRAKRSIAAGERWKKSKLKDSKVKYSKVKGMHTICNANAMQMDKTKYAEFVLLTQGEYQSLLQAHGEPAVKRMVEILNNYKGSNGKKYKSDYLAILNWVVNRYKQEKANPDGKKIIVHEQLQRVEDYHREASGISKADKEKWERENQ